MTAEQFYETGQSPVLLLMQSHPDDKQRIFQFAEAYAHSLTTQNEEEK